MEEVSFKRILRPRTQTQTWQNNSISQKDSEIPIIQQDEKSQELEHVQRVIYQYRLNQEVSRALRNIACSQQIPRSLKKHPLLRHITEISEIFTLNIFELAFWALLVERYVFRGNLVDVRHSLAFCAYVTKMHLNGEIPEYSIQLLEFRIPNFVQKYNFWARQVALEIAISPTQVNCKVNEIIRQQDEQIIDYNYQVDEILHLYTAHNEIEETTNAPQALYPNTITLPKTEAPADPEEVMNLQFPSDDYFEVPSFTFDDWEMMMPLSPQMHAFGQEEDVTRTRDEEEILVVERQPSLLSVLWDVK